MSTPNGETGKAESLTRLALRCWQIDRASMSVRSLNAPGGKSNWIARQMAQPEGNWPHDRPLEATCTFGTLPRKRRGKGDEEAEVPHGPVPAKDCSCGVYATTDLDVINLYLSRTAPVLGVVELGGHLIPATQGYRAQYARIAAVLLVEDVLTEKHGVLRELAAAYQVPALVPHSASPEDYRSLIDPKFALTDDEITRFFRENP